MASVDLFNSPTPSDGRIGYSLIGTTQYIAADIALPATVGLATVNILNKVDNTPLYLSLGAGVWAVSVSTQINPQNNGVMNLQQFSIKLIKADGTTVFSGGSPFSMYGTPPVNALINNVISPSMSGVFVLTAPVTITIAVFYSLVTANDTNVLAGGVNICRYALTKLM